MIAKISVIMKFQVIAKAMSPKWIGLAIMAALLSMSTNVQAAGSAPDNTQAFTTYCAQHFADCQDKIVTLDIGVLAGKLFAKTGQQLCAIPKGIEPDDATRAILGWLGTHQNSVSPKTKDAVQAAVKDLWHCQIEVANRSPGAPPALTGPFIDYCARQSVDCADRILAITISFMVPDKPIHCSPPDKVETQELADRVVGWWKQHKETFNLKVEDGVAVAVDHLWPCH